MAKMRYPGRVNATQLATNWNISREVKKEGKVGWVPCRPEGFASWRERWRCAWLVFTGKADALFWDEQ